MSKYRPIQQVDNRGAVIDFSFANIQNRQSFAGTSNAIYIGYSRPNIDADMPAWMIIKQTFDSTSNIVHVQHAVSGDEQYADYNNVWDDSVAIEISSITKAAIAVATTSAAHGLSTGDYIEIMNSNADEANSDGYGKNLYAIKKIDATSFSLVSPSTGLDVNSSAWTAAATSGNAYNRTYTTLSYA